MDVDRDEILMLHLAPHGRRELGAPAVVGQYMRPVTMVRVTT
jgi:hypothetical protein